MISGRSTERQEEWSERLVMKLYSGRCYKTQKKKILKILKKEMW